jgi:hypothetical protein
MDSNEAISICAATAPTFASKLIIVKDSLPNSASNFTWTVTSQLPVALVGPSNSALFFTHITSGPPAIASFKLDDDGDEVIDESSHVTFSVASGIYTVTELVPPPILGIWHLIAINCGTASYTQDLPNRRVIASVPVDTDVTCTFTNTRSVKIHARKYKDKNGNGTPNKGELFLPGWTIKVYNSANVLVGSKLTNFQGKANFDTLVPGKYTVCEVLTGGWTNTQPGGLANGPPGGPVAGEYCHPQYNLPIPLTTQEVFFGNKLATVTAAGAEDAYAPISPYAGVIFTVDTSHELTDDDSVYYVDDDENTPMPDVDVEAPLGSKIYLPMITK